MGKLGLEIHDFRQLMNFSQTESKVRFYCSPQTRRRKGQGLRGSALPPPHPPPCPQKPLSEALLDLRVAKHSVMWTVQPRGRRLYPRP